MILDGKANFSRLSYPYLRAIFGRHHPLNHSANETNRIRTSVKLRQNAATDLSQFVAFCRRAFAAICRLQPKAFIARTPYSLAEPRFFVHAPATIRPAC